MICKVCGNEIAEGATVCDICGAPVSDTLKEAMQPQGNGTENIIKDPFWEQTKGNNADDASVKKASNATKTFYDPFAPIDNTESANTETPRADGTQQQKYENKANQEPSYDPFASYPNSSDSHPVNGNKTTKESKVQLNRNAIILLSAAIIIIIAVVAVITIFSKTTNNKVADTNNIQYSDSVTDEKSNYDNEKNLASPEIDMDRVNAIIDKDTHNAVMSVCIIDLKTGKEYKTSNADRAMSASAMINIPILYAADNLVKSNGNRLDNIDVRFHYSTSGRSFMEKDQDGNVYDLKYLLSNLLAYSDNNIANTLIDYFGMSNIAALCHKNGYDSVDFQRHIGEQIQNKDNYISASDAAGIIAKLYDSGHEINEDFLKSHFYINDNAVYDGLGKYLPRNIMFLNHNAFTQTTYNEVCIVANIENPYVLAFISNNGNSESSKLIAAQVSEYVFNTLNE